MKVLSAHEHFFCVDGRRIASMESLVVALEAMSEDAFRHHVSAHRNDFSNWLRDCFREPELAESVRHACKAEAARMLAEHLWTSRAPKETRRAPAPPPRMHLQDLVDGIVPELRQRFPHLLSAPELPGSRPNARLALDMRGAALACDASALRWALTHVLSAALRSEPKLVSAKASHDGRRIEVSDDGRMMGREEIRNAMRHGHFSSRGRGRELFAAAEALSGCGGELMLRLDSNRSLTIVTILFPGAAKGGPARRALAAEPARARTHVPKDAARRRP